MIEQLQTFYADLTDNVVQLVASSAGEDPGFMDAEMESGTRWRQELLAKAGTCQVFIALLTESYVRTSTWCAMEWNLFTRRQTLRNGKPHEVPPILAVNWAPIPFALPGEVAEVQRFIPSLPADIKSAYRTNGLFGLYRINRQAFDAVVWSLSLEVQRLYHEFSVEPLLLRDTGGLRRSFGTDEAS